MKLDGSPYMLAVLLSFKMCLSCWHRLLALCIKRARMPMASVLPGNMPEDSIGLLCLGLQWAVTMGSSHTPAGPDNKAMLFVFIHFGIFVPN